MQANYLAERALGYQQITTLGSAQALTVPEGTSLAIITPEVQAIRWRDDGVDPTAAVGYPLPVGAELQYTSKNIKQLKFIEQTAGAVLNIVYYGGA